MSTSSKNKPTKAPKVEHELLQASRNASAYFERFDKSGLHDAAARRSTHWMLSEEAIAAANTSSDYLLPLLQGLQPPLEEDRGYTLLIPWPQSLVGSKPLYLQDLHQITRELVEGIFVFNQSPSLTLEGNADGTTSCFVPSAYWDTLVGDTMLSVDYHMKSLLHGTTINGKDKRSKILEEWKRFVPGKMRNRFEELGLTEMIEDEELGSKVYVDEQKPFVRYPPLLLDRKLAQEQLKQRFSTSEDHSHYLDHMGRDMFLRYLDHVSIDLIFRQKSVQQHEAFLILEPNYDVSTSVKATLKETDPNLYSHLHNYLQKQRDFILQHLETKRQIAYQLQLLGFVSFLLPFLISLKKQNKIVDVSQFLPRLSKDLVRTDRDLPPTLPNKDSRWSPYTAENAHCSLHGGVHFHTLPLTVVSPSFLSPAKLASLDSCLASGDEELINCDLGNTKYYGYNLTLERFYLQTPKQPRWVHAMITELRSQAARQPAITEARVQDNLRKLIGPRQIAAVKNVNTLLQLSVERGMLLGVTVLLKRCTQTRLNKTDDAGMSLLHYAAVNGRGDIISALILSGCQVEQVVGEPCTYPKATQAIHLASQSGGLAAVCCLQHYGAELGAKDDNGWSAIHFAAFHNYQAIVSHLISADTAFLELPTSDREQSTPLILAAQNGCFDSFKRFIDLGAALDITNASSLTAVHLIVLQHQFKLLQYLVQLKAKNIHSLIWKVFAEMLDSDSLEHARAAARILDALTRKVSEQAHPVIEYKIIPLLVKLLKKEDNLPLMAIQVLSNFSNLTIVKSTLLEADAIPCIVKLLSSSSERSQSCSCIVLSDLGVTADNRAAIAKAGALPLLVKLLSSPQDDVCTYACACVGILCTDSASNQNEVAGLFATPTLISLLPSLQSCIQGCAANTIRCLVNGNHANQLLVLSKNILPPLVSLLRSPDQSVHNSAADAIKAIAEKCKRAQKMFMKHPNCVELLKRLLKMRDPTVKVCGGCALWAIAGELISHKRHIAAQIGLALLVDMLTVNDQRLNYVCSEALGALASELGDNQVQILRVGGIKPLLEVLSSAVSERVCLSVIHTLAALCMKPALVPNTMTQKKIGSSRGVSALAAIVASKQVSDIVRVDAACALAKLVLKNRENDHLLSLHKEFSYLTVFKFLSSPDSSVRLLGGYCLSVMAFNNPKKIEQLQAIGSLHYSNFVPFLESTEEFQVHAAFQVVVLSKLLVGIRSVDIAVKGLRLLTHLLTSEMESIKVQSAEFIASLAHTGAGIPDTLVMAGALEKLMQNLLSGSGPVVESCSVALGYFTFNPTAARLITGMFRDSPELFDKFRPHLSTIVVSKKFLANWRYLTDIGLPALSLTMRGGPSITTGRRQLVTTPGDEFPMLSRPESKETTLTFGHDRKTHQLLPDKTLSVGLLLKRKSSLPLNPGSRSLQETKHQRRRQTVPNSLALPTTNELDTRTFTLL